MPVDLNCDMGEGAGKDEQIMPYITSANIACGYHAGDVETMQKTIGLCLKHNVAVGAHPSFNDRSNFGRKEMQLSPFELYELIFQQLIIISEVADVFDTHIHHVKPHGALYNMAAGDIAMSKAIAEAVKDFDEKLMIYGLSGSELIKQAGAIGLKTANEVFADRTYQDDGFLTPRSQPGSLLENVNDVTEQVTSMIKNGTVTTITGKTIPVKTDTICIHGDGENAVEFAMAIHRIITT
jgi:UPF0271 protein